MLLQDHTDSDCCLLCLSVLQFNFVGKLLGPRGNSLKRLQEDTLTKMSILGKGSMRDKEKVKPHSLLPAFLCSSFSFLPRCCTARCRMRLAAADASEVITKESGRVIGNEPVSRNSGPTGAAVALFIQANNKTGLKWE